MVLCVPEKTEWERGWPLDQKQGDLDSGPALHQLAVGNCFPSLVIICSYKMRRKEIFNNFEIYPLLFFWNRFFFLTLTIYVVPTDFSIFAWRIPWTEEPGRLKSMGSQELDTTEWLSACARVRTHTHTHTYVVHIQKIRTLNIIPKEILYLSENLTFHPGWGQSLVKFKKMI